LLLFFATASRRRRRVFAPSVRDSPSLCRAFAPCHPHAPWGLRERESVVDRETGGARKKIRKCSEYLRNRERASGPGDSGALD